MYLTGHPISSKKNDAMVRLRRMHDILIAGDLQVALEEFFLLYESLRPPKDEPNSDIDGLTPPNFANAVAFLDELPMWLFKMVLNCMQTRVTAETKESRSRVSLRKLILEECAQELKRKPRLYNTTRRM